MITGPAAELINQYFDRATRAEAEFTKAKSALISADRCAIKWRNIATEAHEELKEVKEQLHRAKELLAKVFGSQCQWSPGSANACLCRDEEGEACVYAWKFVRTNRKSSNDGFPTPREGRRDDCPYLSFEEKK